MAVRRRPGSGGLASPDAAADDVGHDPTTSAAKIIHRTTAISSRCRGSARTDFGKATADDQGGEGDDETHQRGRSDAVAKETRLRTVGLGMPPVALIDCHRGRRWGADGPESHGRPASAQRHGSASASASTVPEGEGAPRRSRRPPGPRPRPAWSPRNPSSATCLHPAVHLARRTVPRMGDGPGGSPSTRPHLGRRRPAGRRDVGARHAPRDRPRSRTGRQPARTGSPPSLAVLALAADQPAWARPALLVIAALAALSYSWGIEQRPARDVLRRRRPQHVGELAQLLLRRLRPLGHGLGRQVARRLLRPGALGPSLRLPHLVAIALPQAVEGDPHRARPLPGRPAGRRGGRRPGRRRRPGRHAGHHPAQSGQHLRLPPGPAARPGRRRRHQRLPERAPAHPASSRASGSAWPSRPRCSRPGSSSRRSSWPTWSPRPSPAWPRRLGHIALGRLVVVAVSLS